MAYLVDNIAGMVTQVNLQALSEPHDINLATISMKQVRADGMNARSQQGLSRPPSLCMNNSRPSTLHVH